MKLTVEGSDRAELTPGDLATALRDPATLSRAIPGDGEVERTGPGVATVVVTAGIAGTRGTYRARVHVVEAVDDRFVLRIAAAGEPGTIEAELTVELHADGAGTRVDHQLTATLDGRLAGLGHHVLEGAVAVGSRRFVSDLEAAVRTPVRLPSAASSASAGSSGSSGSSASAGSGSAASSASGVSTSGGDGRGADRPASPAANAPRSAASPVRTALIAAAAGALVAVVALRWWDRRRGA